MPNQVEPKHLSLTLGYHNSANQVDTLSQTALYRQPFLSWLSGELGVRAQESALNLQSLHYKLEPTAHVLPFLDLSLRMSTSGYHVEDMGASTLFFRARMHVRPFYWAQVYVSGGYAERYIRLNGFPILFNFSRDIPDNDFGANIGFQFLPSEKWMVDLDLATFDAIQVYNLHNPFLRTALNYQPQPEGWKATLFARYQIVLGFGRLDEMIIGAGLELPY